MAYVPPVGQTTDPDIFMENVKRADQLISGPAGTVPDRGGEPLDTWREMMAKNDEVRQNIIPLSKQYMTLAAAQADIANIPVGSTTYYRSPDNSLLAIEVMNVSGTLQPTGRRMISKEYVDSAIENINHGVYPQDPSLLWDITNNLVIFSGGTTGTYPDWDAYFLPSEPGDEYSYFGVINTSTVGSKNAWIIQCDEDKNYVSDLSTTISSGVATEQGSVSGTAIQKGYVYIRVRKPVNPGWAISFFKKHLVTTEDVGTVGGVAEYDVLKAIGDNGEIIDYTKNGNTFVFGTVINYDGTVNNNAGNDWLAYYFPVSKGDKATMSGIYGAATVGAKMAYFIQLDHDRNFIEPLDIYTSTGQQDVQMTRSVFASQDGVMYVRVRRILGGVAQDYSVTAFQRSYKLLQDIYALQNQVDDLINNGAVQTPVIGATLEKLPIKFDNRYNYNEQMFIQDNVVVAGNYTFVVGTRNNRHSMIMRKDNMSGVWTYFDLHYVTGNPLASPTAEDSHNGYSLGVTRDGYIIVSGNMHANPCRAVISNAPYDITAWTAISYTASPQVSYPRFVKYPDGISQAFWRQGVSAAGQYFSALFDDTTRTFGAVFQIVATDLNANAYEQRLGIGRDGSLHMCFGLRVDAGTADANRGLYYAKSMDKGLTWTNAAGTVNYPAPLTETNSEKIADIALYSGYVNQNGGACDYDSHYHTCLWQTDENNHTQIAHIWFDGTVWHEELVSKFDFKVDTSDSLLKGSMNRPALGCTRYGKTWIFYRTTEMGRDGEIRAIDVSEAGNPVEYIVTGFNMGTLEMAINTNILMEDNQLLMLATRGAIGYGDLTYARYTNEPGYLLMAVMP